MDYKNILNLIIYNVKYTLNNQLLFTFTDILIDKSDLITFIKIKYLI